MSVKTGLNDTLGDGSIAIEEYPTDGETSPGMLDSGGSLWECYVYLPGGYEVFEQRTQGGMIDPISFVLLDEFTDDRVVEFKQAGVTECLPSDNEATVDILARDIKGLYQARIEEELFDSVSGVFNDSPLKLTLVDEDGVVKYTNMENVSMRGDGVDVEAGDPYYALWGDIDESDKVAIENGVESVLDRRVDKFMYDYPVTEGEEKGWAMLYVTWVEYGEETFAVVTQFDVTQTSERLAVLNRIVRHDVSNKLNIVNGYLQSIQDADGDSEHIGMAIGKITDATEAMLDLCSKLREVDSRLRESGKHVVSVEKMVDEAVREVRGKDQDIDIDITTEDDLYVYADTTLSEGLYELLENTVEHVDDASVEVDAFAETVGAEEQVVISIVDDGEGLTERQHELLNGTLRVTQVDHGTGLGLWFVRWLIERFDGEVEFSESDAGGVAVVIRLPKAPPEKYDRN